MLASSKYFLEITNNFNPEVAIILGSGLTNFFEKSDVLHSISYEKLTDFPQPTIQGHVGKLVLGSMYDKKIVCLYGRSHIYEGHNPNILAKPIRFLKLLS